MREPEAVGSELVDESGGRRFRLLRRLGAGGFGSVWLASVQSHSGLEQHVAIKLLHGAADVEMQAAERLRDEALVLASLRHPVILAAHDLVQFGDAGVGLVTEYVEGEDIGVCIHRHRPPIPVGPAVDAIGQVASALDTAWSSLGIVHRDVKPANIRIGRHGNVKLLDFGIARSELLSRVAQTSLGIVGSHGYLAPERFDANREPHPGTDVFALGCVLFEAVAHEALFRGLDMAMIFGLSRSESQFQGYTSGRLDRPMPDPVRELLNDVLHFDPAGRLPAGDLARRCDAVISSLDGGALRGWCRDRTWQPTLPPPNQRPANLPRVVPVEVAPAPLRSIPPSEEGSIEHRMPPVGPQKSRLGRAAVLTAVVGVSAVAAGVGLLVVVAVGVVGFWTPEPPVAPPIAVIAVPQKPGPAVVSPKVVEEPPPSPAVALPQPAPVRDPIPTPPSDLVAPVLPVAVSLAVEGASIELQALDGRMFAPTSVPLGSYDIYADFGSGPQRAGLIVVSEGGPRQVRCNRIRASCSAMP